MEREDGADALGSVVELAGSTADDGQQNRDDLLDAEGTESGQSDDAIEGISAGLEFLDEERQKLFGDDGALAVAEVAREVATGKRLATEKRDPQTVFNKSATVTIVVCNAALRSLVTARRPSKTLRCRVEMGAGVL